MTVAHILAIKGRDVVTAAPDSTVADIAKVLASRGIGAAIITGAERQVLGIISERDIVRAVASGGTLALSDIASRHMTTKLVLGSDEMTVTQAMAHMTAGRFRHLPIVNNGALAGLVSIGDIVKHRLAQIESESNALRDYIATA
jgi:CBS domain-containing protein